MTNKIPIYWKIIVLWATFSLIVFTVLGSYSIVLYTTIFCMGYGLPMFIFRNRLRTRLRISGIAKLLFFLILSLSISAIEEVLAYSTGNRIAYSPVSLDILLVPLIWLPWFLTWYFYLSRKYSFNEYSSLATGGSTGILFEFSGKLFNPSFYPDLLIAVPLAIAVYASILVLPFTLIDFTGKSKSRLRYPVSVLLPFVLSIPVVFAVYIFT